MNGFWDRIAFLAKAGAMIARIAVQVAPDVVELALAHAPDPVQEILAGHNQEGAKPPLYMRREQWYNSKHGLMERQRIFLL